MCIGRHRNGDWTLAAVVEMAVCDVDECLEILKELNLRAARKPAKIVPLFNLRGQIHVRDSLAARRLDELPKRHQARIHFAQLQPDGIRPGNLLDDIIGREIGLLSRPRRVRDCTKLDIQILFQDEAYVAEAERRYGRKQIQYALVRLKQASVKVEVVSPRCRWCKTRR